MPNKNQSPSKGTRHRSKRGVIGSGTASTITATTATATKKYVFLTAAILAAACITRNILIIHIHHGDDILAVSYDPIAFPVENYRNRHHRHSVGCRDESNNDALHGEFERVVLRDGHFSHASTSSPSSLYLPEALRPWQAPISFTSTNNTANESTPNNSKPVRDIISRNNNSTDNYNAKHHPQNQTEDQPPINECCHMPDDQTNKILLRMKPDKFCRHAVCHTPRACDDPIYPFSDARQKDYFRLRQYDKSENRKLRNKCDERNGRLVPPYRWCAQWLMVRRDDLGLARKYDEVENEDEKDLNSTEAPFDATELERYNHQNIDPYEAELPPPGCSTLTHGGGSGSYQNVILFPEGKLAFCGIPKVGITQWIQFLRFTFGARDYRAHPHSKRDQRLFRFDSMREEVQFEILNDPEWKFAVFLRDPEERLLSAYLDKVRPNADDDDEEANHFKSQFNFTESPTFSEFVETIATNRTKCPTGRGSRRDKLYGADWCADPHWRPQTMSCGISEFLPRITYVGSMNHIQSQTRTVLKGQQWEKYGKYFHWDPKFEAKSDEDVCATPPPKLNVGDALIGFQQRPPDLHRSSSCSDNGVKNRQSQNEVSPPAISSGSGGIAGAHHHATGSQSKLDRFYTPRLRRLVREIYRKDYELWDLIRNKSDVVSGSELAMKISGSCKAAAVRVARSAN